MQKFLAFAAVTIVAALVPASCAAEAIVGKVSSVDGKAVRATIDTTLLPVKGDLVEIYFTIPGLEGEKVYVASGRVSEVAADHVVVHVESASGAVLPGYHVQFDSKKPIKRGSSIKPATPAVPPVTGKKPSAVLAVPPATGAKTPEPGGAHLSMKLKLIPAGEFVMGAPKSEATGDLEIPHRVKISKPFYLAAHEVTVGQFRKFVDATGYRTVAERDGKGSEGYNAKLRTLRVGPEFNWRNPGFPQNDNHPVVCVTWDDAVAFCQWLSRRKGDEYRLPTEAEWEYACRAGTTTAWTSGDDGLGLQTTANIADDSLRSVFSEKTISETFYEKVSWNDGHAFTAPVGSFGHNRFGLYDMEGNVREHCQDWFGSPYETPAVSIDPTGPRSSIYGRVQRGGSWCFGPSVARPAARLRLWERADRCYCDTGFRLARTHDGPTDAAK